MRNCNHFCSSSLGPFGHNLLKLAEAKRKICLTESRNRDGKGVPRRLNPGLKSHQELCQLLLGPQQGLCFPLSAWFNFLFLADWFSPCLFSGLSRIPQSQCQITQISDSYWPLGWLDDGIWPNRSNQRGPIGWPLLDIIFGWFLSRRLGKLNFGETKYRE